MKKVAYKFILAVNILLTTGGLVYAQTASRQVSDNNSETVKEIHLEVKLEKGIVNLAETVELALKVRNTSKQHIAIFYDLSDNFSGYEIKVKDSKEEIIQPIKKKNESNGFGSRTKLVLLSGDELNFKIILSEFYQLSVGEYSITVIADFVKYKDADETDSDLVKVAVKPIILKVM